MSSDVPCGWECRARWAHSSETSFDKLASRRESMSNDFLEVYLCSCRLLETRFDTHSPGASRWLRCLFPCFSGRFTISTGAVRWTRYQRSSLARSDYCLRTPGCGRKQGLPSMRKGSPTSLPSEKRIFGGTKSRRHATASSQSTRLHISRSLDGSEPQWPAATTK